MPLDLQLPFPPAPVTKPTYGKGLWTGQCTPGTAPPPQWRQCLHFLQHETVLSGTPGALTRLHDVMPVPSGDPEKRCAALVGWEGKPRKQAVTRVKCGLRPLQSLSPHPTSINPTHPSHLSSIPAFLYQVPLRFLQCSALLGPLPFSLISSPIIE
jgi:hypothetical protein